MKAASATGTPVHARPARSADLAAVAGLAAESGPIGRASLEAALTGSVARLWVLELGCGGATVVVGAVHAHIVAESCEVVDLWVARAHRGRGLGRALMDAFLAAAARAGATLAVLEVARHNAPARALYKRLGFVPMGLRRGYYRRAPATQPDVGDSLTDALTLQKRLEVVD